MKPTVKRFASLAAVFFPAILASSCATLGRQFAFAGPAAIQDGKTTKAGILSEFGNPYRVGYSNGLEKWAYAYYHVSLFGGNEVKDLEIVFAKDGTVQSYTYESSAPTGPDSGWPPSPGLPAHQD